MGRPADDGAGAVQHSGDVLLHSRAQGHRAAPHEPAERREGVRGLLRAADDAVCDVTPRPGTCRRRVRFSGPVICLLTRRGRRITGPLKRTLRREKLSTRALLLILDSVGVGHAPDAAAYGDEGADTLGHL